MAKHSIYLDYAAATPLDSAVLKAMLPYLSDKYHNPSASYLAARQVRQDIDLARALVAWTLGSRPAEVIFTSGATEANNLAIRGVAEAYPGGEILVSAIEHESVLAPAKHMNARLIPVDEKGIVNIEWLKKNISAKTVLVSVMLVNNELGSLQPLGAVAELIRAERKHRLKSGNKNPIYLHTDAAQATNFFDLHVSRLAVDLMSINGGKIYGPKQTGVLYMRAGIKLAPQILGGGQEFGTRSGTENVAGIIGLAEALRAAQEKRLSESARIRGLLEELEVSLSKIYPRVIINGSKKHRAPHILSATFEGLDNERLMIELDERGIEVAVGSACSAAAEKPSHVLAAIGLSKNQARSTLRLSLGRQSTKADIKKTIEVMAGLVGP